MAIVIRNGCKQFGNTGPPVLSNFQLNVEPGTIYGLLGPSGCGKTTALSCMIGLGKLDSGQVLLFGKSPGEDSNIPGPNIGYMPQEAALYPNLSIAEIASHFGQISGMKKQEIQERTDFLANFLQLPDTTRLIRSLSGGELRCVSLAVAMIHEPPILILDEPTAGLDPELRAKVWEYLHAHGQRQQHRKTTVIITTQYIPEATFCDKVGIMRKGRILIEDSPKSMLHQFETPSLEKVFLNLCRVDKISQHIPQNSFKSVDSDDTLVGISLHSIKTIPDKDCREEEDSCPMITWHERRPTDLTIISVLVKKTILRQIRVPVNVVLLLFIPFLLIFLINSIVGTTPHYFELGLVTKDSLNSSHLLQECDIMKETINSSNACDANILQPLTYICAFITQFPQDKIHWIETSTEYEAIEQVKTGHSVGYVVFPQNFSNHFRNRLIFRNNAELETIDGSTLSFRLDVSNAVNSGLLRKLILTTYSAFVKQSAVLCGGNPGLVELPLKFRSLYYGPSSSEGLGWSHYIQPASIILIMSILSSAPGMMTAIEKRLGYLDRDFIAGVKFRHLMASSLLHGSIVIILQLSTTFTFLPLVYGMRSQGPWLLVLLLVYLSCLSGVALGFLWGITARHEMDVVMVLLGLNICYIGGAGAIWPLEGIPFWYRKLCYLLPVTLPISTLRSIIHRGWDFDHYQVWIGFAGTIFWIIAPLAAAAYFYKIKCGR